jgi:hypothetical protein
MGTEAVGRGGRGTGERRGAAEEEKPCPCLHLVDDASSPMWARKVPWKGCDSLEGVRFIKGVDMGFRLELVAGKILNNVTIMNSFPS